jgi:hypothetical protein
MVPQAKRLERDALTSIYYHIISCVLKISPEIILIQMVTKFWLLPTLLSFLPTLLHLLPTLLHPPAFHLISAPDRLMMYLGIFESSPAFS